MLCFWSTIYRASAVSLNRSTGYSEAPEDRPLSQALARGARRHKATETINRPDAVAVTALLPLLPGDDLTFERSGTEVRWPVQILYCFPTVMYQIVGASSLALPSFQFCNFYIQYFLTQVLQVYQVFLPMIVLFCSGFSFVFMSILETSYCIYIETTLNFMNYFILLFCFYFFVLVPGRKCFVWKLLGSAEAN